MPARHHPSSHSPSRHLATSRTLSHWARWDKKRKDLKSWLNGELSRTLNQCTKQCPEQWLSRAIGRDQRCGKRGLLAAAVGRFDCMICGKRALFICLITHLYCFCQRQPQELLCCTMHVWWLTLSSYKNKINTYSNASFVFKLLRGNTNVSRRTKMSLK